MRNPPAGTSVGGLRSREQDRRFLQHALDGAPAAECQPTQSFSEIVGRMVPIEIAAIDWIQAEGDYARVHAGGKSCLVARSLTDLESWLDPERIARIHRSAIVNRERIQEVRPEGSRHTSFSPTAPASSSAGAGQSPAGLKTLSRPPL